jgi:hypothetical protein
MPWRPNPEGPRTLEQAVEIARGIGIEIPDDVKFMIWKGPWPKNRFAEYLQLGDKDVSEFITWERFYNKFEEIPVRLNPEILASDEAIVAVIGHEMHELNGLRRLFEEAGGQIRRVRLARLIREGEPGNLHDQAWDVADQWVAKLRAKTPPAGKPKEKPMSEKQDAEGDLQFVFDLVEAYNEGHYTKWELFAEIFRHLHDGNVGRAIDALPADLRTGFIDWAKDYDSDVDPSEYISIGGEGCRETPREAFFAIRRWFDSHRDDNR